MNFIGNMNLHWQTDCLSLPSDYHGARAAGMHALLIRRHGSDGEGEHREEGEDLRDVSTVPNLLAVLDWVKQQNGGRKPTAE